jgi:predicted Kef-type K+ transport protein
MEAHAGKSSQVTESNIFSIRAWKQKLSLTKLEAVLFFIDLITIFVRKTLHSRPIRPMATSVILLVVKDEASRFNNN